MPDTLVPEQGPQPAVAAAGGAWVRRLAWTLISFGAVLLLYVVYLLWFTGLETDRVQQRFLAEWELEVGQVDAGPVLPGEGDTAADVDVAGEVPDGEALAVLWFERPSTGEDPVLDEPVFVVDGTSLDRLRLGPGRYENAALPGADGNFAIAGHRTTWSAPFYDLDDLVEGDLVHVTDRSGATHTYEVVVEVVVPPSAFEVTGPDPLGTGAPLLTITTCHPRFSDAQRLVVHAELVS